MNNDRAFEFDDLMVLLTLDPTDPADAPDIAAIDEVLARRRVSTSNAEPRPHQRTVLRLVPDAPL
jgi:hypothetical protein